MKFSRADWLLLGLAVLLFTAICVTLARADEHTATVTWRQWRQLIAQCHIRAAGPVQPPLAKPPEAQLFTVPYTGTPEQLACAAALLHATPTTGGTTP